MGRDLYTPDHLGFANSLDSPEFMDVLLLKLAGLSAGACISVPGGRKSDTVRPALRNLDGTAFLLDPTLDSAAILRCWAIEQERQLKCGSVPADALRENVSSATDILEKNAPGPVGDETVARAQILKAMLYALSGSVAPVYTLHGSLEVDRIRTIEDQGVPDLTSVGLSRLHEDLRRVRGLRVSGSPGLFVSDRVTDPLPCRPTWIDDVAVDRALRGEVALVGPARFLLAHKLGRQLNVPWYLRPRQLSIEPTSEHDIPLTQVAMPFWCRWSDQLLPKNLSNSLASYAMWQMDPPHLLSTLAGAGRRDISREGRQVLGLLDRWLYGRRQGHSQLRFLDAVRQILRSTGRDGLCEAAAFLGITSHPLGEYIGPREPPLESRVYCSLVGEIAARMLSIGQLSVPRVFALLTKRDSLKLVDGVARFDQGGGRFPTIHLRVFART